MKYSLILKNIIYLLLIIILFLVMKYFYLKNFYKSFIKIKEDFENKVGEEDKKNKCKNTSFCAYDLNKNKCVCASQKDDARLQFPNEPNCCETECSNLPKEKCVNQNDLNVKYYCNVGGICKEFNATMKDSVIMANICGIDNVTNQYIMPYASKEECMYRVDVCNKYNEPKLKENECLKDKNCGLCYNESGLGKCVMGSPVGPNDLSTYYFCKPNERKSNGSNNGVYKYGSEFSGL